MSVTLRVYDTAKRNKKYKNYIDRYCLYVPTPRNKIKDWGFMGMIPYPSVKIDKEFFVC